MAQKSEQKRVEKTKPVEYKYKSLSDADKRDVHIKAPILGWEVNVDKRKAREGLVVFNAGLMSFIIESTGLIIQAIEDLNHALGQAAPQAVLKVLHTLARFPKEKNEELVGLHPLECPCCFELYNMMDKKAGLSPVVNSAGETYCKDCMQQREEARGPVSFADGVLEPLDKKEDGKPLYSLTNISLINAVGHYLKFTKEFTAAVVKCISMVVRLAVKKNAHHHAGASDDKAVVANNQIVDPMTIFLLELGMPWRFFVPQNFYAVFEKLSPTTQRRCFAAPQTHGNDLFKMLQKIEEIGKERKDEEYVKKSKQAALECAAKHAHEFVNNLQYFESHVGVINTLFQQGTPLSETFVQEFPPGIIKDTLQKRLDIRKNKREKNAKVKHDLAEEKSLIPDVDPKEFDPMVADYNKYHQVFVSDREWILGQSGYDSAEVNKLYFGVSFCLAYDMAKKCLALARGGEKYNQQLMEKIIDCAVNRVFGIYKEKSQKEKKDTFYFFAHVLLNSLSGETFAVVQKVTSILSKKFKSINVNDIFPDEFLNMDADDDHVFDESLYNKTYSDWRRRLGVDFAVMMLRYNARKKGALPPVTQVSPPRPLDHKSSPAMLLASSMPFLAAVSSFATPKKESATDTGDFLPDVFSQGMQEAEEQVTEQSKICLAELNALLSGDNDDLFNKLSSEYEDHGAKCIKHLDVLINEGGIIEAKALGYILIDKLQGIAPKLREVGCSEEQIAQVELLVEKDINEICQLMKKLGEARVARNGCG
jgi:hypothetical protein